MSELLTTGQMIDRLKPGEVAESKNRKAYYDSNCQLIVESKLTGEKEPFTIWSGDKSPIWRILPKYVSFEEAMKALWEGKKVRLYIDGKIHTFKDYENGQFWHCVGEMCGRIDFVNMRYIKEGKWSIEE